MVVREYEQHPTNQEAAAHERYQHHRQRRQGRSDLRPCRQGWTHRRSDESRCRQGAGALDAQAKAYVSAVHREPRLRPMDTGPLSMARTLEHACLLSPGLIAHSVKHTNFSIGVSLLG